MFGIGVLGLSFANRLYLLYIQALLIGIGFNAGFQLPIQTATANWFIKRRCIAIALISTAPLIGRGIKDFFGDKLSNLIDFQTGLLVLGILALLIGIPLAFVFRHRPEQYGYLPDGLSIKSAELINKQENHIKEINFSLGQALKTRTFWMLSLAIALGTGSSLIMKVHLIPLLMNQGYEIESAKALSNIMHLLGLVGILIFGYLGDKFPKRYLLALAVTIKSLSIFIPVITNNSAMVYLYFFLAGLGDGVIPLILAIREDYFGRKAFATITVIMIFISTFPISFIVGLLPILLSRNQLFPMIIILSGLVAAIMFFFSTPPEQPQQEALAKNEIKGNRNYDS